MTGATLGVVIPTINEAGHLPRLLADLAEVPLPLRVVVADGGSADDTLERARAGGAVCVSGPRGRASQMNAGARAIDTPWLLFLHADSRLPLASRSALVSALQSDNGPAAAYFPFRLSGRGWFWRLVETGQRVRERLTGLVYGDQGLLVRREAFEAVGGYPELPLMEDVEMVRRLRRSGRIARLRGPLLTSPRTYQRLGRWKVWLRNGAATSLYLAGVAPERLARWYPERVPASENGHNR